MYRKSLVRKELKVAAISLHVKCDGAAESMVNMLHRSVCILSV